MLSQTSEHAIRALLFLARHPEGEPVPADRVARALGAPANYLGKTLNVLARQGLVASTRGPAGGFRLRRAAGQITLAEVVDAFGEARPAALCLMGDRPCDQARPCDAHHQWTAVTCAMRSPLQTTTIADLLAPPRTALNTAGLAGIHGRTASAV